MGTSVVFMIWVVIATALAWAGSAVLRALTTALTKRAIERRKNLVLAATFFPFLCLGWGVGVFVCQWVINESVFHRDPGIGDEWKCPLPNGYSLLMIDAPDQAWIFNSRTQPGPGLVGEQADAISGVDLAQVSGAYIAGRASGYFLIDTATGTEERFSSLDALSAAARPHGVEVNLQRIGRFYSQCRVTWFDYFAVALFLIPVAVGLVALVAWTWRARTART